MRNIFQIARGLGIYGHDELRTSIRYYPPRFVSYADISSFNSYDSR